MAKKTKLWFWDEVDEAFIALVARHQGLTASQVGQMNRIAFHVNELKSSNESSWQTRIRKGGE